MIEILITLFVFLLCLVIASALDPDLRNAWKLLRRKEDE